MPEIVNCQRTQEWHDARHGRVTASLAAACLGLDKHTSRQKAVRLILGHEKEDENRFMRWGVQFEATARLDYEAISGNLVQETGFWVHPTLPWLGASPDGLIGADGLLECKCPTECPTHVRLSHRIQCLIQLACTERLWVDYFSWGAGGVWFLKRIYRSGIPGLLVRLEQFYRMHILTGIEPPRKRPKRHKKTA